MPTMTIYPYLIDSYWVFDDERTGLKEEAFVFGMTDMISRTVDAKAIPNAANGFAMSFDAVPFDHDVELIWIKRAEAAKRRKCRVNDLPDHGNWYRGMVFGEDMSGWLCPALFHFFDSAPPNIFVKAAPLPEGIDPIWHNAAADPRAMRFMSPDDDRHS